jgi:hypothetical protein
VQLDEQRSGVEQCLLQPRLRDQLGAFQSPGHGQQFLVQVYRDGAWQTNLARLLDGCREVPLYGEIARRAGRLCGLAGRSDVTDAVVAVIAAEHAATVVTSDPDDLSHLLGHLRDGDRVEVVVT